MTLAQDREKWNQRYEEARVHHAPAPHPLAVRWRSRMIGGRMLDAACGMGRGVAVAGHLFHTIYAVDISDVAIAWGRRLWPAPNIEWTVGDVTAQQWPADHLGLVCALGFTDLPFFERVRASICPGGMFLYEGFSKRQLQVKKEMDPAWAADPADLMRVLPGWEVLEQGEIADPPYRTRFAALRPLIG